MVKDFEYTVSQVTIKRCYFDTGLVKEQNFGFYYSKLYFKFDESFTPYGFYHSFRMKH